MDNSDNQLTSGLLITFARSHLPYKVTYSRELIIRIWTSLRAHYQELYPPM